MSHAAQSFHLAPDAPAFVSRPVVLRRRVYFIGNGIQSMAAAWLMVELAGSSFLAALVQTAVFLPMFLLALPAGVLADITDRRRLISGALLAQVAACALLALLVLAGRGGPASMLFLVFVCGCCTAVLTPAWNSSVIDPVPREEWTQAITAVGIAYKRGPRQKKQCRGSPPGFAAAACATAKRFLWASAPPPTPSPAFTAAKTSANASFGCNRHTDAGQQIVSKRLRFSVDLT